MVGHPWQEDGVQQRLAAQGLVTLVQAGERRFILTHDDWSLADDALSHVTLHGAQLLVLNGAARQMKQIQSHRRANRTEEYRVSCPATLSNPTLAVINHIV